MKFKVKMTQTFEIDTAGFDNDFKQELRSYLSAKPGEIVEAPALKQAIEEMLDNDPEFVIGEPSDLEAESIDYEAEISPDEKFEMPDEEPNED